MRSSHCVISEGLETQSHEEADTLIPLNVLEIWQSGSMKHVDVHCADTDILLLLMDLVANDRHGSCIIKMVKMDNF